MSATRAPEIGAVSPPIDVVRLDGLRVTDESLRGRSVLLLFLRHLR
ncbi:MAG: hypothetical protein JSW67_09875 [Candidatus Latescibacterota bacterium]|nr:MAG: hypothetical protein JSW67_09875 [Candidatus Latescibacterota bacterium]